MCIWVLEDKLMREHLCFYLIAYTRVKMLRAHSCSNVGSCHWGLVMSNISKCCFFVHESDPVGEKRHLLTLRYSWLQSLSLPAYRILSTLRHLPRMPLWAIPQNHFFVFWPVDKAIVLNLRRKHSQTVKEFLCPLPSGVLNMWVGAARPGSEIMTWKPTYQVLKVGFLAQ